MVRTWLSCILVFLSASGLVLSAPALGEELLVNGDFEIGTPQDDKSDTFVCHAWRRLLWKETLPNSWLTDGKLDRPVGVDNQALEFRWGATSVCQYFSATTGETYQFSVRYLNPGRPDSRWQPRIQVEWMAAENTAIGRLVTVAEADYATAPAKAWNAIDGTAVAPANTAYGRVLLNVNNKGSGQYFQKTYLDDASVRGAPGKHNLPASFASSPYDMVLDAIPESRRFDDSLTNYADDKDGDSLTFTRLSGPKWLTVESDGAMGGTPRFADAGDNRLVVKVEDGHGSSETRTLTIPVIGSLRLGNLFDDDMVFQRDALIPVSGKAVANQPVRVLMSTGESASTTAGADGDWAVTLPAMKVTTSGSVAMSVISGTREFQLSNLLVGDVWLCSGQSNMSWPLVNTDGSKQEITSAGNSYLRVVTTPDTRSSAPWADLDERAEWQSCRPDVAGDFSAVAYYFGKNLQTELTIPIGLIVSSQGGSRIESWATSLAPRKSPPLYNARVHPYTRMPIKGAIWYQAEANIKDGPAYTAKMQALVSEWRKAWGGDEFPFYFVQLAPFDYRGDEVFQLPKLWAAQTAAMDLIPNSGMAVINDLGNPGNIHPTNKAPVGERLARWALHGAYDKELVHTGPIVIKVTRSGDQLRVNFDSIGSGLVSRDGQPLTWFEVAGADQVYTAATATIDDDSVVVGAPGIALPQWLRFAWHETAEPNLMNVEGLPANSFVVQVERTHRAP
jgi:sialate O-acetylesterase